MYHLAKVGVRGKVLVLQANRDSGRWKTARLLTGGLKVRILLAELRQRVRNFPPRQFTPRAESRRSRPAPSTPHLRAFQRHCRFHRALLFERDNSGSEPNPAGSSRTPSFSHRNSRALAPRPARGLTAGTSRPAP